MKKMDNQSEKRKSNRSGRIVLFVLLCIVLLLVVLFWDTIKDYFGMLFAGIGDSQVQLQME